MQQDDGAPGPPLSDVDMEPVHGEGMRVHDTHGTSPETPAEYAERSFRNWQAAAAGWDAQRAHLAAAMQPLTLWLLAALDLRPGESVLELAGGPGELAMAIAPRLRPGGRLICTDRSPQMVEAARRATRDRGLENVEHQVADAHHLELADAAMDAVVCRMGYMLMADPGQGFGETARVLRPGGRAAFTVWAAADRNRWATALHDVVEAEGGQPPAAPGGPGMFSLADDRRRSALLTGAGLEIKRSEQIAVAWEYSGFEEYWEVSRSLNGGVARLCAELAEPDLARLRERVRSAIEPFRSDVGYHMPGLALGVLASR
jgi:ubiquinone/menaquinone biosynthesis C-methylase UbiE